jgi:hypothetical protein
MEGSNAWKLAALFFVLVFIGMCRASNEEVGVPRITIEELNALPADTEVRILDVRTQASWEGSDRRIKGAIRENPNEVEAWAGKYPKDKMLVVYCS